MKIADRQLGDGYPPIVVAEVGLNHNGSVETALKTVGVAATCGVDAVKFGVFKADEFCAKADPLYEYFRRCELPADAWYEIKAHCEKNKVIFFATPQNVSDMELLLKVGVPCLKVGSDDLVNLPLIHAYAAMRLPLILSTGMADGDEVHAAYLEARMAGAEDILVLACTSEYPCAPDHANIARVAELRRRYGYSGYSDHTSDIWAGAFAAAIGAHYVEKHFTLDNNAEGPDHKWAANPKTLSNWVWAIEYASTLRGSAMIYPTEAELENRKKWRRTAGRQLRGEYA